jgi:hypothetical protein
MHVIDFKTVATFQLPSTLFSLDEKYQRLQHTTEDGNIQINIYITVETYTVQFKDRRY